MGSRDPEADRTAVLVPTVDEADMVVHAVGPADANEDIDPSASSVVQLTTGPGAGARDPRADEIIELVDTAAEADIHIYAVGAGVAAEPEPAPEPEPEPEPGFDIETDIPWHSFLWAEGTDFKVIAYADTADMALIPNETGETDLNVQPGGSLPKYDAAHASWNNKPVFAFTEDSISSLAFAVNPVYPISIVAFMRVANGEVTEVFFDGIADGARNNVFMQADVYRMHAGSSFGTAAPTSEAASLLVGVFTGDNAKETIAVNGGAKQEVTTDAGSETITGITLGGSYAGAFEFNGEIAVYGIFEGDIEAHASWDDLKSFARDHYGMTIA